MALVVPWKTLGFFGVFCVGFAPKNLEPRLFHEAEMEHSQK